MIRHAIAISGLIFVPAAHITSLDLDVVVNSQSRSMIVSGATVITTDGTTSPLTLVIASQGIQFDSARADVPVQVIYNSQRDSLTITPTNASRTITVRFSMHTTGDLGRSLIRDDGAMMSWGARWYPTLAGTDEIDFPGTTRITMPTVWHSLSSGQLVDSVVTASTRTETWCAVRPTARSFVAAPFIPRWVRVADANVGVYLLRRHANRADEYAAAIPKMVQVLSSYFGPYPFASFGIAELPRGVAPPGFGGRSEPNYFIAHTDALEGPGVNVPVFAHELTHMWFPNAVDSRPPGDDMMDEAIANYGIALYLERTVGRARARQELIDGSPDFSMSAYFNQIRAGVDEPLMTDYSPTIARSKGPIFYDMLRRRVGDSVFFSVWRDLAAHGGSASLADLRRMYLERASRDSGLATFLAQWLDRKGSPEIDVQREKNGTFILTQNGELYVLDVPVRLVRGRQVRDTVIHIAARRTTLDVRGVSKIELDPHDDVLLWKPRFGPPPSAPRSWDYARWRAWFDREVAWLMEKYEVKEARIDVTQRGRVLWNAQFGNRVTTDDDVLTSVVADSVTGARVEVVSHGGWGRPQLASQIARRIAIQYGWSLK
jgi:aminopeptidase N